MARGMHKGPRGEKKPIEQTNLGKRQANFAEMTGYRKPGSNKK